MSVFEIQHERKKSTSKNSQTEFPQLKYDQNENKIDTKMTNRNASQTHPI